MHDTIPHGKPAPDAGPSGCHLLLGDDAADHLRRRVKSRDWWLFVANERRGIAFIRHLEDTYFAGPASADCELVMLPALHEGFGVVGLFLAKKSRLSAAALRRELAGSAGPVTEEELQARDINFLHADPTTGWALVRFVGRFLSPRPRPGDN
jgi:hypothetical protein